MKAGGRRVTAADGGREIVAYGVMRDLWGSPVLVVEAHISQEIGIWSRQTFWISVTMMLALALLFSVIQLSLLLRAVVRPLGMLQGHVREYEKDDARIMPWPISRRKDEIGGLAAAFEHMSVSLALKRGELVAANENLEAKVEERTRELRKAGEDLRLLANVVESTGSSVVITDLAGRILKVNEAFCTTSGYSEAELLGKNPRILKSDRHDQQFYKVFWEKLTTEGKWQGEIWDRRKDGGIFPKWLTVNLIRDEKGEPFCYVGVSSDISNIKAAEERLHELAYFDPLTSLPNRSLFLDRLDHGILHGLRYGDRQALLFIDLDRFKYVNDALGHNSGDQLLVEVARRITRRVRKSDTVCRLGGDEFTVILEQLRRSEDAGVIAQSIIEELGKPFTVNGREVFIGASIGIAVCPEDDATAEGLTRKAEAAMYQAKAAGRNGFHFVSRETDAVSQARLAMEAELRRAVERAEFVLHYQPIVELDTARVVGAEALVRWRRPGEAQLVPPGSFISLAEETGTILQVGLWVLKASCAAAAQWRSEGHALSISVNVSARQFSHAGLVRDVAAALAETGLPPELLVIELTESAVMADVEAAQRTMVDLKNLGVSIAIDDFGTGYSSLSYLCRFPVDRLKIDQSFVRGIGSAPRMDALADAIIAMAKSLGIGAIAEGVETQDQRAFLASRGCVEGQGFFFSKPIPSEEFLLFARSARITPA